MSKVAIQGNASGTGTLTVAAPNTNSDYTLTLPAQTGTIVSTDASGNVGIGKTNPSQKLHVYENASYCIQLIENQTTSLQFQVNDGVGAGTGVIYMNGAYPLTVWTNGSERARFLANGPLRIGDLTDDLFAGNNQSGISLSGNGYATLRVRRGADTGSCALFYGYGSSSSAVGGITVSNTGTAFNTSSDYRLKENVAPMTGALSIVAQLKPCTYTWKADGSAGQGFIAHELQAVVPDAVSGNKDAVDAEGNPVYQGVDTSFLVATLTAAIQELKAELDAAKERISALEGGAA